MVTNFRKPLILFTPKSLLRHPEVVSDVDDLITGKFETVISDNDVNSKDVSSIVFCSGKFYYDLLKFRREKKIKNVALIRLEQLFPLPIQEIDLELNKFSKATDFVWAQEEPRNMGVWSHFLMHYPHANKFMNFQRKFLLDVR